MHEGPIEKEDAVKVGPVTTKMEINLGTVIPILVMVAGWVWWISAASSNLNQLRTDFDTYRTEHAEVHKEGSAQREGQIARLDTRLGAVEGINGQYRLTNLEAQYQSTSRSVSDLKTEMGELRAEQRLTNQKLDQLINIMNGTHPFAAPRGNQ